MLLAIDILTVIEVGFINPLLVGLLPGEIEVLAGYLSRSSSCVGKVITL